MAAEVARVCGLREAEGYLRFVDHARRLWELERRDFIERNLDGPRDLLTGNLFRLVLAGGVRRLQRKGDPYLRGPPTRRVFFFQGPHAGPPPPDPASLYAVI